MTSIKVVKGLEDPRIRLRPGDSVEISISSQVKIDNDENWIGIKVFHQIQADEKDSQALAETLATTLASFELTVRETVEKIQEMSA